MVKTTRGFSILTLGCFMVFVSTLKDVFLMSKLPLGSLTITLERGGTIKVEVDEGGGSQVADFAHLERNMHPRRLHPFAGARYPDGTWGYVADVYKVRKHYLELYDEYYRKTSKIRQKQLKRKQALHPMYTFLPMDQMENENPREKSEFERVCNTPAGEGVEKRKGYMLLMSRIQVNGPDPPPIRVANTSLFNVDTVPGSLSSSSGVRSSKILCVLLTHAGAKSRVEGITSTWGWRCDGFIAASTETIMDDPREPGFGSVDIPHMGKESYTNLWQKTRSIAAYVHENYLSKNMFDYVYLLGDDSHVVVENLRNYLHSLETEKNITTDVIENVGDARTHDTVPIFVGGASPGPGDGPDGPQYAYPGGGSGYLLNRAALKAFIDRGLECYPNSETSAEDRLMGKCMHGLGIDLLNTADAQKRQRFFGMDPNWISDFNGDHGYFARVYRFLNSTQGLGFKTGHDIVSTQSIALHKLKTPELIKRVHAILYRSCPESSLLGDDQVQWDQYFVPTPRRELAKIKDESYV